MEPLTWEAWVTLAVVGAIMVALVRELVRPDLAFLGGLGALLLTGVVTPDAAFAGFANTAVLTIGALFVVAAGVQRTEALSFLDRLLFARSQRLAVVLPRLMLPTAVLSAFMNNTPIVAMLTPRVQRWARLSGIPSSKLLMPLSFAAIVGGMGTLIGTSTTIIASELMAEQTGAGFTMFDITWIGVPVACCVILYLSLVGHRLLPGHTVDAASAVRGLKDCLFELRVRSGAERETVDEAGLRALGDAYLVHIRRGEHVMQATPSEVLQDGDILTFVGDAAVLERLLAQPEYERVVAQQADAFQTLPLFEAVVADSSSLLGKSLRETHFRDQYGGVVLGIQRRGERVDGPLGRVPIKAGDLLLVEAHNGFDARWNASRDEFYLVAPRGSLPSRPLTGRAPLALAVVAAMFTVVALGWMPLVTAAFSAAVAMVVLRCVRGNEARRAVNLQVLVVIAAALGIGRAFDVTGLTSLITDGLLSITPHLGLLGVLVVLYVATNVLTEVIANAAAAVLMLPIGLAAAASLGVDPRAFALVVTVAAAASFITPIGYQTNLMVMAAGGYRFTDYTRAGLPIAALVLTITVAVVYLRWLI